MDASPSSANRRKPTAYRELRDIMERYGGRMEHVKKGYRSGGAWELSLGDKRAVIESTGSRSFPQLDRLYQPRPECPNPRTWHDFSGPLVPNAEAQLLALLQ
jgi:hypothetical protein